MISIENGLKLATEILNTNGIEFLAVEAADILKKHRDNEQINSKERFIIGLAYYEFYTNDTSDMGFHRAYLKQQGFCKKLGIDSYMFQKQVETLL